jgi:GNAT superfamily N-acetyltransferase
MDLYRSLSDDDLEFRFMTSHHLSEEEARAIAESNQRTTLVATKGESLVGEATLEEDGEVSIVVDKEYRQEGVGTMLLKALISEARNRGLKNVKFYCLPSNIHMIWLGSLLGFGLLEQHETEDEYVLNL